MDLKWGFSGRKSFFDEKLPQRHLLEHTGGCTPKQEEGLEQSNLKKGPSLSYIQKGIFASFWPVRAGGGRCVALSAGSVPAQADHRPGPEPPAQRGRELLHQRQVDGRRGGSAAVRRLPRLR